LNQHTAVKELVFCLDDDLAGREATATMARKYAYKSYTALNEPPRGKTTTRIYKPTERKNAPRNAFRSGAMT
jgi:DNA primase